jgi:dihydrofolate synthase/folylpolyglutamate synthase
LLAALGNPERDLPNIVHVAGTNGKGSVVAMTGAICAAAGLRVHSYTSPHLVRFNERISVAGKPIADDALAEILAECEAANKGEPITFFEITTAAAYLAFARTPADVVVVETGLGGRLDATNLFPAPAVTAITPVSRDHVQFLGDNIGAIAAEKAGILKAGVKAVIGPQMPDAMAAIAARADETGAELVCWDTDYRADAVTDGIAYRDGALNITLPCPALAGVHQIVNAGIAVACARRLGIAAIDEAALAAGLAQVRWPGRLQHLKQGRFASCLGAGWELWLDGGHNEAAAHAIAATIAGSADWRARPLYLVFGTLSARDPEPFLAPLASHVRGLRAVRIPATEGAMAAGDAAAAARRAGIESKPSDDVAAALADIAAAAPEPGRVLICGSLYLAGHVLAENG